MGTESLYMAGGFLNMTMVSEATAELNSYCDDMWIPALDKSFHNKRVVGQGATACVYLATDETNTLVAVKVGKSEGKYSSWVKECNAMQNMRKRGCTAGGDIFKIHEMYLPTCTSVGQVENAGAYYVMHAAGTRGINAVKPDHRGNSKARLSEKDRKNVMAQMVTAIWGLHAVDLTHNDLHGNNIVLSLDPSEKSPPELSLIDFGSLKSMQKSWKKGYKRDGNAVWRWAAPLGGCPKGADWPRVPNGEAGAAFIDCMERFSGGEESFMSAIRTVVAHDIERNEDHHIKELYESKFIQDNRPDWEVRYPWIGTKDMKCP